ncbi:transcription antitermination factor NusB [Bacteroidetes/Chlorobi group bacterium ChocPot_Mid]|jgi:N utilization substance protein B|nr:MAG: transcription antitermination factor NusB [Bacteroidetes/Chlorobi group bacterium ChocPot_Mid]
MIKVEEINEQFTLSKKKTISGSRRLAREKVLQILMSTDTSEISWQENFSHIFFRKFNFGDNEEKSEKILTEDEVTELESDIPIIWDDEEIEFARSLIKLTLDNREKINNLIQQHTANWHLDRIAKIDILLMQIAITEILHFEEIPTKVSINEAIDIAKKYSTPKSGNFINGILDSIFVDLKNENLIKKSGRGLIDN